MCSHCIGRGEASLSKEFFVCLGISFHLHLLPGKAVSDSYHLGEGGGRGRRALARGQAGAWPGTFHMHHPSHVLSVEEILWQREGRGLPLTEPLATGSA